MKAVCKMTGKEVVLPCGSAGCPLFGDCLVAYEKETAKPKPQTNADHIRSMTDEELKLFLCSMTTCEFCDFASAAGCTVIEWLKQPYKEEST